MEKIDSTEIATVDVIYENWVEVREHENTHWNEEAEVIRQFKYYLNDLIMQLDDGTMEQLIIKIENNI